MEVRSSATFINEKLKKLCRDTNVKFLDLWERFFDEEEFLYSNGGTHLNSVGNARLRRILEKGVGGTLRDGILWGFNL